MMSETAVLLVDDDESIRASLTYFFRKKTRSFKGVPTAEAALALLGRETDWDAVISDFKLPGMDGLTFLKEVHERLPEAKTALITAYASLDIVTEALRAGVHDFIQKPFKAAMVAEAIKRMTARAAERPEATLPSAEANNRHPFPSWRDDLEFTIQKVTHQMNNAFAALRGKAELGLRKHPSARNTDKFQEILDILASVEALNKELMSFGKALSHHPLVEVDVREQIRERTLAHAAVFHEAGVRLVLKNAGNGDAIVATCADPLNHILDNILINAIQGCAGVVDRDREIIVTIIPRKERILIRVVDNGIGMDPATLDKACWKGFTTKPDGNGLGLFITQRLCRIINATMTMESQANRGTTVTIGLPRSLRSAEASSSTV